MHPCCGLKHRLKLFSFLFSIRWREEYAKSRSNVKNAWQTKCSGNGNEEANCYAAITTFPKEKPHTKILAMHFMQNKMLASHCIWGKKRVKTFISFERLKWKTFWNCARTSKYTLFTVRCGVTEIACTNQNLISTKKNLVQVCTDLFSMFISNDICSFFLIEKFFFCKEFPLALYRHPTPV